MTAILTWTHKLGRTAFSKSITICWATTIAFWQHAFPFKKIFVALQILKSRVKSYIYTNHIDYREKQQFAQALDMRISPTIGRKKI